MQTNVYHINIGEGAIVGNIGSYVSTEDMSVSSRTEFQAKDGLPSVDEIREIASKIAEKWDRDLVFPYRFVRAVGLNDRYIEEIQADNNSDYEKCLKILLIWKQKNGTNATYKRLAQALFPVGLHFLAEKYCAKKAEDLPVLNRNELQTKVGLPSNDELSLMAEKIPLTWRQLGRALGQEEHQLDTINADVQSVYEKSYQMLKKWKQNNGAQATYKLLGKALQSIGLRSLAEEYCADKVEEDAEEAIPIRDKSKVFSKEFTGSEQSPEKSAGRVLEQELLANRPASQSKQMEKEIQTSSGNGDSNRMQGAGFFNLTYRDYEKATEGFQKKLGSGGEGDVYYGKWNGLELAVKKVENLKSFEREKQMKDMRHPFILPVWDVVKSKRKDQPHLIVYPYMKNGNLFDAIVNGKKEISYKRRIAIALNLVLALKYLHSKGFVYRDFKSANVLLDENLNPRLGDYGLAKQISPSDSMASTSGGLTSLELLSVRKGTAGYVCPKYMETLRCRPENDLFGLGVVMLELLTGCHGSDESGRALPVRMELDEYYENPTEACRIIQGSETYMGSIRNAGWPDPKQHKAAFKFATLAIKCLPMKLQQRISLRKLSRLLKKLAVEEAREQLKLYCDVSNLVDAKCVYCLRRKRSQLLPRCNHLTSCMNCLKLSKGALCCPHCCDENHSLIGNPQSIALCIGGAGEFPEERSLGGAKQDDTVIKHDVESFIRILKDGKLLNFKEKQVHHLTTDTRPKSSLENIKSKLKEIKENFDNIRKEAEENSEDPTLNLLVYLSGHFNKLGKISLPGGKMLQGQEFLKELQEVKADNILVFVDGCFAESFFYQFDDYEEELQALSMDSGCSFESQPPSLFARVRNFVLRRNSSKTDSTGPEESLDPGSELESIPSGNNMILFKNNFVAYCSSSAEGTSPFSPILNGGKVEVHNSDFTKFLLNGIGGAKQCYNPFKGEIASANCDICVSFREKLGKIMCLELDDLMNYVTKHMELYYKTPNLPKKMYVGDGSKMVLAFHEDV